MMDALLQGLFRLGWDAIAIQEAVWEDESIILEFKAKYMN